MKTRISSVTDKIGPLGLYFLLLVSFSKHVIAEDGTVIFNVDESPTISKPLQGVTLIGCHTRKDIKVLWGQPDQSFNDIPFGVQHTKTGQEYFASKYYMASPPLPELDTEEGGSRQILGQLMPDNFVFQNVPPSQITKMDYSVLRPVYLEKIGVDFDYVQFTESELTTCAAQKVDFVPINVACTNLVWSDGRMGASGIGFLENTLNLPKPKPNTFFIPKFEKDGNVLNCSATILNDIILEHQVFFQGEFGPTETISMTELYNGNKAMQLVCQARQPNDVPTGCRPPWPL